MKDLKNKSRNYMKIEGNGIAFNIRKISLKLKLKFPIRRWMLPEM